jgi:hypothetical protein
MARGVQDGVPHGRACVAERKGDMAAQIESVPVERRGGGRGLDRHFGGQRRIERGSEH